jgi:hypothetical protein
MWRMVLPLVFLLLGCGARRSAVVEVHERSLDDLIADLMADDAAEDAAADAEAPEAVAAGNLPPDDDPALPPAVEPLDFGDLFQGVLEPRARVLRLVGEVRRDSDLIVRVDAFEVRGLRGEVVVYDDDGRTLGRAPLDGRGSRLGPLPVRRGAVYVMVEAADGAAEVDVRADLRSRAVARR